MARNTSEEWLEFHYLNHADPETGDYTPFLIRADNIEFIDKSSKDGVTLLHVKGGGIIPLSERYDKAKEIAQAASKREKMSCSFKPHGKHVVG